MKKYKTILFDLDDTLIDTQGNSKEALAEVYAIYSLDRYFSSYENFERKYLKINDALWDKYNRNKLTKKLLLEQRFVLPFKDFPEVNYGLTQEINSDYLKRMNEKKGTIEGAFEILDYLKNDYEMHILSNGFTEMQYKKLESAGLTGYFDEIILSDAVGCNKPDSCIFEYAVSKLKIRKEDTVMIGDNIATDIKGAKNVNIDQIWYAPNGAVADIEPTYKVKRLIDLKGIL